jgi:amino acid transporter
MGHGEKMGFNATWSMAVGGMVGGGIFSVLGVIIASAGKWAWLSFSIAGVVALISAHSYNQLSLKYQKSGGAFLFLSEINHKGLAGSLAWVLILGYVLTISIYAFTFGHYVANVLELGTWFPRVLALAVIAVLALTNLRGVGNSSKVEIITVWGKLFVLLGLSVFGLIQWDTAQLSSGFEITKPWSAAIVGAATIFMAYEGFQLLSYDYEDIQNPQKTLPKATIAAVISVIVVYIMVTFGATMLVGAETLIDKKEVALSIAGQEALGLKGLIVVTIAAAFSTGSAINATLFSTGRLMENVAKKKDLPHLFAKENNQSIPLYSILGIAGLAAILSAIGSLKSLVDSASLIFLITFGAVNLIAFMQRIRYRYLSLTGAASCLLAIFISGIEQMEKKPLALISIVALIVAILVARPILLKRIG